MKSVLRSGLTLALLSSLAHAQNAKPAADVLDDLPKEDVPKSAPAAKGAADSIDSLEKALEQTEKKGAPTAAANSADAKPADTTAETAATKPTPPAEAPVEAPAAPPAAEAAPVAEAPPPPENPPNETPSAEIRALEKNLENGSAIGAGGPEQYEPGEPGGTLKPSDRFARVPLRPRMSDANWKKWIGPMLDKTHHIRRNDTLWGVSEKLFGNPYLWPKVWQLNAQIGNPHIIQPRLELAFTPGNPNSAPNLAFKTFPGMSVEDLPFMTSSRKLSLMEFLDETLRQQIVSSQPPFQYFFERSSPPYLDKVPKPENNLRVFHDVGDGFMVPKLADGDYSIARARATSGKTTSGYRVHWIGSIHVERRRATITRAFAEIGEGDLILAKPFQLSPLALYETRIGVDDRDRTKIVTVQEGYETLAASNMLVGVRFAGSDRGPRAGALLTVSQGPRKIGTLLVIDRDRDLGTAWVVESTRELDGNTDKID